jgi:hypothetical protein
MRKNQFSGSWFYAWLCHVAVHLAQLRNCVSKITAPDDSSKEVEDHASSFMKLDVPMLFAWLESARRNSSFQSRTSTGRFGVYPEDSEGRLSKQLFSNFEFADVRIQTLSRKCINFVVSLDLCAYK